MATWVEKKLWEKKQDEPLKHLFAANCILFVPAQTNKDIIYPKHLKSNIESALSSRCHFYATLHLVHTGTSSRHLAKVTCQQFLVLSVLKLKYLTPSPSCIHQNPPSPSKLLCSVLQKTLKIFICFWSFNSSKFGSYMNCLMSNIMSHCKMSAQNRVTFLGEKEGEMWGY